MISVLHPYAALKPSDGRWLGIMPEHWEVRRLKDLGYLKSGTGFPHSHQGNLLAEFPFFKVGDMAVSGNEQLMQVWNHTITEDTVNTLGAHVFQPNTIVFAKVGAALLLNRRRILTRPSCLDNNMMGFLPKGHSSKWMYHWLSTVDLRMMVNPGAVPSVNEGQLEVLPVLVPPLPEQTSIVRYLDNADEQIGRYISGKERLIALLEEERQAVIHQAVTKGLDPNVRLKDSGVEWLGDVPEHWRVGPLKRAFVSMDYGISESASDSGAIHLLTMGNLRDGQVIVPQEGGVDSVDPYLLLREGDLLFNRTNSRELVGKVGLFAGHESPTTFASYLVRMRPHPNHAPEYLNMALNDTSFISSARRESVPSLHQSNLNPTRYGRLHIALPPKEEQSVMLRVLQEETVTLRNSVAQAHHQIDLMNEYRTRLIADVVTGQLDVREAAEELPTPEPTEITD